MNQILKKKYRDIILGVTKSNNKGLDTNNRHKVNKVISIVKMDDMETKKCTKI